MRWAFWRQARREPSRPLLPVRRPTINEPGWETTEDEFQGLLDDLQWRAVVAPVLREWFDCDVVGPKGAPELRTAAGERLSASDLHRRIQADPERRYALYQRKMSCFHWDDFAERLYAKHLAAQAAGRAL